MTQKNNNHRPKSLGNSLPERYPPSPPCACEVCQGYCIRPGWWTVKEAARAVEAGYSPRMMLEMSPDRTFGVVAPAFPGCEMAFADYCQSGCTFLVDGRCELHGTGFQPLECRYCHHTRPGKGPGCHAAIGEDWNSIAGRALVVRWAKLTGFWERLALSSMTASSSIGNRATARRAPAR
jgi:hypothetical protein